MGAQNNDAVKRSLADDFFHGREFGKSIDLYEDLYKRDKSKDLYFDLLEAYIQSERLSDAAKMVKKELKRSPSDPDYQVDYGYLLIAMGDVKKGESVYKDAIKDLPPVTNDVLALSNSFQRRDEIDYAISCLKRGKKLTGNYYGYEFELGELYYQKGDIESMVSEYLDLLEKNEGYLQNVQNALNTSIYSDPKPAQIEILNTALLKRIQRNPNNAIFSEMLIWHYLQQKDFRGAITQSKALDKRNKENGYRFLNLAKSCRSNREYDLAIECYQYIIDKGSSNQNYVNARILITETIREKITSAPYTYDDLLTMESNYIEALNDVGKNSATVSLQIGLAEVWAFYLDKADNGIDMLKRSISYPGITPVNKAKCKLMLADIYLSVNEIWEASLLYSQVEKDFKYEAIGDEAKFKNAKIYFYTGDFDWSKAQLDVLKGSTSKLISNDAMRLSLLISDNLAFDTTGEALKMYGRAAMSYDQNRLEDAKVVLDSMENIYVVHDIIDEVYFLQYEISFKNQDYVVASEYLRKIIADHHYEILADEAIFRLAEIYENYLDDKEKAQEYYSKLFNDYPASIYVVESRSRYRQIRGDQIN